MISLGTAPCDDGVIQSKSKDAECAESAKFWVLAATILGLSIAFIDGSVVNVALPAIQQELTASVARVQWVVNAYGLLLASLILIAGSAGDRFGRRRMFMQGIAIYRCVNLVRTDTRYWAIDRCAGSAGDRRSNVGAQQSGNHQRFF